MLFRFILILSVLLLFSSKGESSNITETQINKIVDAIYLAEGGPKAKVPYGILSVKVKDKAEARRVCQNTVRNNYQRWIKAGKPGDFITFLGNRYCPKSVDKEGNKNWIKNVKYYVR